MAVLSSVPMVTFCFVEIIGALISVQLIWIVTGILVYMAVQRCISMDYKIEPLTMMVTAACAVLFNIM